MGEHPVDQNTSLSSLVIKFIFSSENEEEEDHYDIVEEEEELPATLKSDHEFSPESDIENDEEWKPVRHARTAQKR